MVVIEFKSKRDKERLLEKARKMEEYASMIVDCIEESKAREEYDDEDYAERRYKEAEDMMNRYNYRRGRMR